MESINDDQEHKSSASSRDNDPGRNKTVRFTSDTINQNDTHDAGSMRQEGRHDHCSIRQKVTFEKRRFDVKTLPNDLYRVYNKLEIDFGEEYALTTVFMIRTAIELHRAWHNTLLTAKILQQLKDKFHIRLTWELGVIKLKFHVEDGFLELQRTVPYDYDSEFQDLYMKIAVAYLDGHMTIHQALLYQSETKCGKHTATVGLFIRDFPGRLVVYPLEAATCAVIFFQGDFYDFGVAALTGFASGLVEYLLVTIGGSAKLLVDVTVGISTGFFAGLFYKYNGQSTCMPAIFLGTLYWFFYGTAFVVGILEIISGELETGVVRFMAVSVKTFILSVGTALGMLIILLNPKDAWFDVNGNCGNIDLDEQWWRIPMYLLCSASALAQYRFPLVNYWRGLAVQLVGYEVQYQVSKHLATRHPADYLDTAASNLVAAIAAVVFASILSSFVQNITYYYHARVLQRHKGKFSPFGEFIYTLNEKYIRITRRLRCGKKNDLVFLEMSKKLQRQREELDDSDDSRTEIALTEKEEMVLLEAVIEAEDLNVWALLMPTLYQLVPGSIIARLWFGTIFPSPLDSEIKMIDGKAYEFVKPDQSMAQAVIENLMVTATSLALGTLVGFCLVEGGLFILNKTKKIFCRNLENQSSTSDSSARLKRDKTSRNLYSHTFNENNPDSNSADNNEDVLNNEEDEFDDNNMPEPDNDMFQPLLESHDTL